jgi:hypothetical protein
MGAVGVTSDVAFAAFPCVLAAEGKHLPTVTAPVRADVGQRLEAVRNAMVDLLFVFLRQ